MSTDSNGYEKISPETYAFLGRYRATHRDAAYYVELGKCIVADMRASSPGHLPAEFFEEATCVAPDEKDGGRIGNEIYGLFSEAIPREYEDIPAPAASMP